MLNFMTCDNVSKVEIIINLFEKNITVVGNFDRSHSTYEILQPSIENKTQTNKLERILLAKT